MTQVINTTYQQQKQQVLTLFQQVSEAAQAQNNPEIQTFLNEAATRLEQDKLFVVVCGEFKQGKSSLLNAFLDTPGLFPVDVDITTNLVSTISDSPEEKITIFLGDPQQETQKVIQRSEIPEYVTEQGNPANVQKARLLAIETVNPKLREGLVLVDTPGAGSLNQQHTDIAYAILPNADVILFVSDVLTPMSQAELEFVKQIHQQCSNIIFVATKIDTKQDYRSVIANNQEKLSQTLNCAPQDLTVIPVSSRAKLDYLKTNALEDLEDSNFAALEKALWELIKNRRGRLLLEQSLSKLNRAVVALKTPLQAELKAYQLKNQQDIDELEQQFQQTRRKLQELLQQDAQWQQQLNDEVAILHNLSLDRFQQQFEQLRSSTLSGSKYDALLKQPTQASHQLEAQIDALMTDMAKWLHLQVDILRTQLESTTKLSFRSVMVALDPVSVDLSESASPHVWAENTVKHMDSGVSVVGVLGKLIGFGIGCAIGEAEAGEAVGALVGIVLGGIAGFTISLGRKLIQKPQMSKEELTQLIEQFFDESQKLCVTALEEAMDDLKQSVQNEFRNQLHQQQDTCERTLHSVQQLRSLSKQQADERVNELQLPLRQFDEYQRQVFGLAELI